MKQPTRTVLIWGILILFMVMFYQTVNNKNRGVEEISFTDFIRMAIGVQDDAGSIDDPASAVEPGSVNASPVEFIEVRGLDILGRRSDGKRFRTVGKLTESQTDKLIARNVQIRNKKPEGESFWITLIGTWLPVLLLVFLIIFFFRQLQAGSGRAMSFGKSKHRMLNESQNKKTFQDVAGVDEAKEELEEIIEFLRDPQKFTRLGGRVPKGVLLMGPPGTGKTLLAKAVAGEASVPFFTISGSEFVEMFVGVGASRVRDLFEQAKKNAPCIIFVDEIDAVGRHRGAGLGGGHDEREQTLNQLLVEMDGFETQSGVIIMAATNRPDVLDPALLRPGRFDRRIVVPRPDIKGREQILGIHSRKTPLSENVLLDVVARATPGFSGADLENLVNEAALSAARQDKNMLEMSDFELAKDKVMMGTERRSMVLSIKEKRTTAWHEAGHALVARLIEGPCDPVHKVTIIPRGMALGLTQQIPEEDMHSFSDDYVSNRIAVAMGGRIAEELMFGEKTTGAGNDFVQATELARKMVCDWGMSELGPLSYGQNDQPVFLGMDISQGHKAYSEKTAQRIDEQVTIIVTTQYNRARKVLEDNRTLLDALSEALLEWETLDTEQVDYVVEGKDLRELQESRDKARAAEKKGLKRKKKGPAEPSTDEDPDSSGPIKDPDMEPA